MSDATATATPSAAPAAPAAPAPPAAPATSRQAAARLAELRETPEWGAKVLAQDPSALSEFHALSKLVAQSNPIDIVMSGEAAGLPDTGYNGQPSLAAAAREVPALRESGLSDDVIKELLSGRESTPQELDAVKRFKAMRHSSKDWVDRYLKGDHEAVRESRLMSMVLMQAPA
jgi:hypothetical protein